MKFDIGEFYKNLSAHYNFGLDQTTIMDTLHEDLHEFSCMQDSPGIHILVSRPQLCYVYIF
jgi:hypothetical protein